MSVTPPLKKSFPLAVRRVDRILGQVEAQLERQPAVLRLVEADRRRSGRRVAPARDSRDGVPGDGRADPDVPRVARVDRDLADAAVLGDREAPRHEVPVVAPVGRLVEAEAGLAVARAAGLAGADVDRLAALVGRVDQQRADRRRVEPVGERLPLRLLLQRVVRPPDAAAGRADVEAAVVVIALRVDRHRGHAARPLCRQAVVLSRLPGDVHRERPDLVPARSALAVVAVPLGRRERVLLLLHGNRRVREGLVGVRLLGGGDELLRRLASGHDLLARHRKRHAVHGLARVRARECKRLGAERRAGGFVLGRAQASDP